MSRAGLVTVALLGGTVGLVLFFLTRGLPDEAKGAAAQAVTALEGAKSRLAAEQQQFEEVVAQDKAFLDGRGEVAMAREELVEVGRNLLKVEDKYKADLKPLTEADRHKDATRVYVLSAELVSGVASALANVSEPVANANRVLGYKKNHADLMKSARQSLLEAEQLAGDSTLPALVQSAGAQYPEAAGTLQNRLVKLREVAASLTQAQAKLDTALATAPVDYVVTGRLAEEISRGAHALSTSRAGLITDLGALDKSVDRILIDMKEEDGTCHHKYRVVENGLSQEPGFQLVDCAFYREHEDHLGMTLYSKPAGKLDEEAVKIAAPPGYSYVGNTRYGQWRESGGTRFWEFYGQYALMRDVLWGGSYRPVQENHYNTYRGNVSSRRPWYGASNEYGTKGEITKTKYAGSSFYQKQAERARYAGSRHQESNQGRAGGGYQGSRYQGGGGSAPVRSGGSRSTPVRRSSFGGGGK